MKGSAIAYGGILAMLIIVTFVFISITAKPEIERYVISSEGKLINFVNEAELLVKNFDTSISFISQRAAYELGKSGGIEGNDVAVWYTNYPSIDDLESQLKTSIEENLPEGEIDEEMVTEWGEGTVDVVVDEDCTATNDCFFVDGEKMINIYDENIDSRVSLDPHEFYIRVESNYLKLLEAGRAIMENEDYNQYLGDYGRLWTELNNAKDPSNPSFDSRFRDLSFNLKDLGDDIIEVTISEMCYPSSYYCLAPLEADETGISDFSGNPIHYDYVKLTFRYDVEQTSYTGPSYSFDLLVDPYKGELEVVCS